MTIHDNQLHLLTAEKLNELFAAVVADPEMEPVHQLSVLNDQHAAEFDAAIRLRKQEADAKTEAIALDKRMKELQKAHDLLGDRIRLTEERNIKNALAMKGIEDLRAIHGPRTESVVRQYVLTLLATEDVYVTWQRELGDMQKTLNKLPGEIKKVVARATKRGKEADAQAKKAGAILMDIRKLEAELNG